jgi:hypothetical protein
MWTLLFPFIALLARVRAEDFDYPVQINFVVEDSNDPKDYIWEETTSSWSGKPNTPTDIGDSGDVGHVKILGPDDKRTFMWSNPDIEGGALHKVCALRTRWLQHHVLTPDPV